MLMPKRPVFLVWKEACHCQCSQRDYSKDWNTRKVLRVPRIETPVPETASTLILELN